MSQRINLLGIHVMLRTRQIRINSNHKTLRRFDSCKVNLRTSVLHAQVRSLSQTKENQPVPVEMTIDTVKCCDDMMKNNQKLCDRIETLKTDCVKKYAHDGKILAELLDLVKKQSELSSQILSIQKRNQQSFKMKTKEIDNKITQIMEYNKSDNSGTIFILGTSVIICFMIIFGYV